MSLRAAILAILFTGQAAAWAAESFPYTGYINASDVYLRSGPGENYYPVSKLERGEAVEVYRHDPGGWYAIRPTQDCFSWISAEFLEPAEGNLAVVKGDRVVARVGSVFNDVRDVIQVRLERGETVEVIEAKRFNSGPGAQTWYKIAPPAGEFRWISGKFIDRELPERKPRSPSPDNNLILAKHSRHDRAADLDAEDGDDTGSDGDRWWESDEDQEYSDEELEADEHPVRRAVHQDAASDKSRRDQELEDDEPIGDDEPDPLQTDRGIAAERDDGDLSLKDLAAELDLELSARVAKEPDEWRFSDLKRRAETALARAETATDRGRIRRVLRKIERFAELQRRYASVMNVRGETDRLNGRLASADRAAIRPGPAIAAQPRFDGIGRLTQVMAKDPGSPQFALLDAQGQVAYYVSPSPGINLRRFLNQEVGINGTLGYLPDQRARHVTAQRVVSVDSRLLR